MSFLRMVRLLFGLALIWPATGRMQDTVIYPHSGTPAAVSAPGGTAGFNPGLLLLALAAAAAGGWLLWRQRRSPQGLAAREARKLSVSETRSLGNRQYLVVADYEGRKFLLGVCPGRIDLLAPLEGESPPRSS